MVRAEDSVSLRVLVMPAGEPRGGMVRPISPAARGERNGVVAATR